MKKLVILFLLIASSIIAQESTHTVKEGDTLWDIAQMYYQNPFLWPYIWRANLTKIQDPHWIYPDQVFVIPPSPETTAVAPETTAAPPYVPSVTQPTPVKKAAEVISVVKSEEHIFSEAMLHRAGFIVTEDMPVWGRILQTEPKSDPTITTFDRVYIDRVEGVKVGDKLTVYRPGQNYDDPQTGKFLGKQIIVLGKLEVSELGKDGCRCKVINSYDIIHIGDQVMPYEPLVAPGNIQLVAATRELEGYVVYVDDRGLMLTPSHVFVVLNQGEESGVIVGDLFEVYQERVIDGKKMPDFDIAQVQVMSVFQNASIGLLLWSRETANMKRGEHCRLFQEAR